MCLVVEHDPHNDTQPLNLSDIGGPDRKSKERLAVVMKNQGLPQHYAISSARMGIRAHPKVATLGCGSKILEICAYFSRCEETKECQNAVSLN
jgi:hypothetical protein